MAPFWDNTGDADGSTSGNYFPPIEAEYDLEIEGVRHKPPGTGYKGESVIVEVCVISSSTPEVPVGAHKSCAWNITKQPVLALNNIKSFVCGIYGLDDSAKDPETKTKVNHVSRRMVEADNPLMRTRVHLSTFKKTIERTGKPFTVLDWSPYTAEPGYVPPFPSAAALSYNGVAAPPPAFAPPTSYVASPLAPPPPPPPPPPAPERYYPEGTTPGRGATHRLVNGAWSPL